MQRSEEHTSELDAESFADLKPSGIIFSGGPTSVNVEGAPKIDPGIYDLGVPILGICYGAQLIAQQNGGSVDGNEKGEYGRTVVNVNQAGILLSDFETSTQQVWMSHFDSITSLVRLWPNRAEQPTGGTKAHHSSGKSQNGPQWMTAQPGHQPLRLGGRHRPQAGYGA